MAFAGVAMTATVALSITALVARGHRRPVAAVAVAAAVVWCAAAVLSDRADRTFRTGREMLGTIVPGVGLVVAGIVCGWPVDRRSARGLCRRCGYDLTGNVSGVCPECGTPFHRRPDASAVVDALARLDVSAGSTDAEGAVPLGGPAAAGSEAPLHELASDPPDEVGCPLKVV